MGINEQFNVRRFWLLLKKDFYTQYKTYLVAFAAVFCILSIINILSVASHDSWDFNLVFFPLTLYICGFIFTSMSFRELEHAQSRIVSLMLPASVFEKFVSKLLVSSVGFMIVSAGLYFVFSISMFAINSLIFGAAHRIFDPFHPVIVYNIGIYLVTQSVFFIGAVYFRKNAFIRTIVFAFVAAIAYAVFVTIAGFVSFSILFAIKRIDFPFDLFFKGQYYPVVPPVLKEMSVWIAFVTQLLFRCALAPVMWVISFFRLREIEV